MGTIDLTGTTVYCSLERHLTLTVPSTQEYKWVPAKCDKMTEGNLRSEGFFFSFFFYLCAESGSGKRAEEHGHGPGL